MFDLLIYVRRKWYHFQSHFSIENEWGKNTDHTMQMNLDCWDKNIAWMRYAT